MERSKKKKLHTIIAMLLLAVIVVTAFFMISRRGEDSQKNQKKSSEVEKLLAKDLENAYPGTPREVLRLYSRMIKCLYGNTLTDSQVEQMAEQLRSLFDEELLVHNPQEEYLEELQTELETYRTMEKSIVSYVVEKSSSVKKYTREGKQYATILVTYLVEQKGKYEKSYEEFVLREDDEAHWKILGWRLVQPTEVEDEDV